MDDFLYNLRKSVEDRSRSGNRHTDSKNQRGGDRRCGMDRRDRKPQKHHHDRRSYNPFNRAMNEIKQLLEKLLASQARQRSIDEERLKLEIRRTEAMERIADSLGRAAGAQMVVEAAAAPSAEAEMEPEVTGTHAAQMDEASTVEEPPSAAVLMTSLRASGKSYEKIAQVLEEKGISTVSGRGRWRGQTVKRELAKLGVDG